MEQMAQEIQPGAEMMTTLDSIVNLSTNQHSSSSKIKKS